MYDSASPFTDMKSQGIGSMPICDGIYVTVSGNLAFTTAKGTAIAAFAVTAGQLIPCRARSIDANTTATVLACYHTPL